METLTKNGKIYYPIKDYGNWILFRYKIGDVELHEGFVKHELGMVPVVIEKTVYINPEKVKR